MRNYRNIYSIIDKLKDKEPLNDEECNDLVNILEPALGEFIPTYEEYCDYSYNIEQILEKQESIKTVDDIPALVDKCNKYNEKYHKGE